ncbi:metal-dependent transcriptional regulator [Adhaeribacter radiodurans]|uniref:Transcriptional regulator MntR n=1 Tax=Adhaeribacter radiodurans TaxID=2745197 RepID=A0A7L7L6J5_9BACT|nr:metal-dependent transcriptional regulator [Adhaeribacter radiodurans]QMU28374.1 metal-dependent transcriptional regulator [Adhaeribacter radiodurans]
MLSYTEENYIKTIYKLSQSNNREVNTNAIAEALQTKAASVSDMLKKLSGKNIIFYVKYRGVSLSPEGQQIALQIIRKHRLWEVFLVEKLRFNWDEVHEVAEELEHITSPLLVQRLDEFLGFPKIDPHGDPIPTDEGIIHQPEQVLAADLSVNASGVVSGVKDKQPLFLQHLDKIGICLGMKITVLNQIAYDKSMEIKLEDDKNLVISHEVARNLFITI